MSDQPSRDAVTTPAALSSVCPACGATMPTAGATCARCGAAMTAGSGMEAAEKIRRRLQESIGESYKLLELLGRGGMGIVFRALEVALDREVALKVLALDPLLNPDAYQRFEREAKLAARLDHPNIVPIFSVGQQESVAYYTMRLVRGGTVEEMLQKSRQLEYDHIVAVLRDVAAALDYAHGRGVVHRDIKPANILIGETGHALVADFGIARALGPTASGATGTGIIGSPGYMSPEQWRGDELGGRADQYALGIVAFEMLTGRRPFETPSLQDLMKLHLTAQVRSVNNWRQGLPDQVDAAIRRALAKDAAERFSSATGFVDALTGLRPVGIGTRTLHGPKFEVRAPSRRKRRPLVWLLVLATAMAASAFAIPQTRPHAIRYWTQSRTRSDALLREYGVTWERHDPTTRLAYDTIHPPATDSMATSGTRDTTRDGGRTSSVDSATPGRSQVPTLERRPIGIDTTLYGSEPPPFRRARGADEFGFLRVVVRGGAAPVIVDGRELNVTAGPLGQIIRVSTGAHYVSVRGAGVLFQPSQHAITVDGRDTLSLVFAVPASPVSDSTAQLGDSAIPPRDSASTPTPPPLDQR